jgi:hypothetical protein
MCPAYAFVSTGMGMAGTEDLHQPRLRQGAARQDVPQWLLRLHELANTVDRDEWDEPVAVIG